MNSVGRLIIIRCLISALMFHMAPYQYTRPWAFNLCLLAFYNPEWGTLHPRNADNRTEESSSHMDVRYAYLILTKSFICIF